MLHPRKGQRSIASARAVQNYKSDCQGCSASLRSWSCGTTTAHTWERISLSSFWAFASRWYKKNKFTFFFSQKKASSTQNFRQNTDGQTDRPKDGQTFGLLLSGDTKKYVYILRQKKASSTQNFRRNTDGQTDRQTNRKTDKNKQVDTQSELLGSKLHLFYTQIT